MPGLLNVCRKIIGDKTRPDHDVIINKALQAAINRRPVVFITALQNCLEDINFPERWTLQKPALGHQTTRRYIIVSNHLLIGYNRKGICATHFSEEKSTISDCKY